MTLQVVQAFVRQSMGYIEKTPDKESKLELIKTLQTVTEGKVVLLTQDTLLGTMQEHDLERHRCSHQVPLPTDIFNYVLTRIFSWLLHFA